METFWVLTRIRGVRFTSLDNLKGGGGWGGA